MSALSLTSIPIDVLGQICRFVAENPNDLLKLGTVCKKTNQIVNSTIFANLLTCFKELVPLKNRLSELRGPNGFNGLINQAYVRLIFAENLKASSAKFLESINGFSQPSSNPNFQQAVNDYTNSLAMMSDASTEFSDLQGELSEYAKFDNNGAIIGGKVFELSQKIELEIKKLQ